MLDGRKSYLINFDWRLPKAKVHPNNVEFNLVSIEEKIFKCFFCPKKRLFCIILKNKFTSNPRIYDKNNFWECS